ncbi:MAG TPA: hypothetical protein VM513_16880 [Kofleriaceae bacterium]|jgi:hypothetical protein|nr:hypothetical protein [Kofleriaceae bacterium]
MSEWGGVPAVRESGFAAEVTSVEPLVLVMRGNADATVETALGELVEQLHRLAAAQHARVVRVDLSQVEFMNASSLNAFTLWLTLIEELPAADRYVLRFTLDPKRLWQHRSLRTLSCFASELVEVEP